MDKTLIIHVVSVNLPWIREIPGDEIASSHHGGLSVPVIEPSAVTFVPSIYATSTSTSVGPLKILILKLIITNNNYVTFTFIRVDDQHNVNA